MLFFIRLRLYFYNLLANFVEKPGFQTGILLMVVSDFSCQNKKRPGSEPGRIGNG